MCWEKSRQRGPDGGEIWIYEIKNDCDWEIARGGVKFPNKVAEDNATDHVRTQLEADRTIDAEVNILKGEFRLHNAHYTSPWQPVTERFMG